MPHPVDRTVSVIQTQGWGTMGWGDAWGGATSHSVTGQVVRRRLQFSRGEQQIGTRVMPVART